MLPRGMRTLAIIAAALQLLCLVWLGHEQRGGPTHLDLVIPGGIPATLYLPGPPVGAPRLPDPPGAGNAPPAVLLVHGYSADRAGTSVLARRLANAGYGVLAVDLRGHGQNERPFARDPDGANLFEDLAAAVDWLRASSWLDGSRLAVVGHSMGAGAVLRFAERDVGVDAVIAISGGAVLLGPLRPPNALFLTAAHDPARIREAAQRLAARLSGEGEGEVGSFGGRDAVRAVEIPGNDHTPILWSAAAAREMIAWLDASFGVEDGSEPDLAEPRALPALLAAALSPITLLGVGLALGSLVPAWPSRESRRARALAGLALALLAALPLVSAAPLAAFLGLDVADVLAGHLFGAGLLLCGGIALGGERLIPDRGAAARSVLVGATGFAVLYALLAPLGVLAHELAPGPARARAMVPLALLLFPFFLGFEHCVRRGGAWASFALGLAGRAITLAAIGLGVALGVVPFVVTLLAAPLALAFLLGEIVATGVHAAGGNRLVSATLQAAFLAWLIAAIMPLRG
jgi:dienelactone hydrolase